MSQSLSNRDVPLRAWLSRTFGGVQGQRGAATSWSAAPLSIFRAAPIANWQQEAGLPKTAFASNGITALGLIPFHQKCGRAKVTEPSLRGIWCSLCEVLDGKSVVIVGLDGIERHWTVAYAATERTLRVADSCGMRMILRAQCTVGRTSLRYQLRPSELLVVNQESNT